MERNFGTIYNFVQLIFVIQVSLEGSESVEINSFLCVTKICFHWNPQRNGKKKLFSQETRNLQIVRDDIVVIADYKDIRIYSFYLLIQKRWQKG